MKKLYFIVVLCMAVVVLTNCGGKKGTAMSVAHVKIPQDVSAVMSVDLSLLQSKTTSIKNAMNGEMFKKLDIPTEMAVVLKQVVEAVDTDQKMYFFTKVATQGSYMAISFVLKDANKLKKAFDQAPTKPKFEKEGDIELAVTPQIAIGFKGKTGLILINESPKNTLNGGAEEPMEEEEPSMDNEEEQPKKNARKSGKNARNEHKPMNQGEFKTTFVKVFKTTEAESLKESNFIIAEKAGYDVSFWYDNEAIQKVASNDSQEMFQMFPFMKQLTELKGTSYMGLRFNNGEAVMELTTNMDKETSKKYANIMAQATADKLGQNIPINKPSALMSFSINTTALYDFMKDDEKSLDGMAMNAREFNMKPKDMFDMFNGNVVLATGSFKVAELMMFNPKSLELVLAVGLNKKDNFKKILKKLVQQGELKDKGKGIYTMKPVMRGMSDMFLIEKNDAFYITPSSKVKDALVSGKGGMDVSQIKGNMFSMYTDLKAIIAQVPNDMKTDKAANQMLEKLKDLSISVTPIKNNMTTGKLVLRFNESKNALKIISEMMENAVNAQKKRELSIR